MTDPCEPRRKPPGKCRFPEDRCRRLIALTAEMALMLEATGDAQSAISDALGSIGADAERLLDR